MRSLVLWLQVFFNRHFVSLASNRRTLKYRGSLSTVFGCKLDKKRASADTEACNEVMRNVKQA